MSRARVACTCHVHVGYSRLCYTFLQVMRMRLQTMQQPEAMGGWCTARITANLLARAVQE